METQTGNYDVRAHNQPVIDFALRVKNARVYAQACDAIGSTEKIIEDFALYQLGRSQNRAELSRLSDFVSINHKTLGEGDIKWKSAKN